MDSFWTYVEKVIHDDKLVLECKFCKQSFSKDTAITRIKWHLSRERNHGVAICTGEVPTEVQQSAFLAASHGNKRQKTVASSSTVNDNVISSCPQEENNEFNNLAGAAGGIQMLIQGSEQGVGEGRTFSREETGIHMEGIELGVGEGRTSRAAGNHMKNAAANNMHIDRSITAEGIIGDAHETRGEASQVTELVEKHQEVGWAVSPDFTEFMDRVFAGEHGLLLDALESEPRIGQGDQVLDHVENVTAVVGASSSEGLQQPVVGARSSVGLQQPVVGARSSVGLQQPVVGASSSGGFLQPVVGASSSEGFLQPVVGARSSVGLQQPVVGARSSVGLQQPVVGASSSGGFLQPVVGASSSGGFLQPVVGSSSSEVLQQPVVGASSSEGLQQPDVGASSSEGLQQPVVGARSSVGLQQPFVGASFLQPAVGASYSGGLLQPVVCTSSSGELTHNICDTRGDPLLTSSTKAVGQAFEDNRKLIWSWLRDDEVSNVAIIGMGGVGKTRLVTQIYNELLETPDVFLNVYWITVPKYFSICRLQNSIANRIGLDLSNEEELPHGAAKLSKELRKKQKWVLILDNLWNSFELHEVGIPEYVKGCKLIATARSEKICHWKDKQIKMDPLLEGEDLTLFMETLGHNITLSQDLKDIAQFITRKCEGLPLAVITMAATMKGVVDVREWRNVLAELEEPKARQDDMESKVFKMLRLSYTHLKNPSLEQCFLYCSLFPEGFEVDRDDLIGYLIDEGIIEGTWRIRQAEFDKGHAMLNELLKVCLLQGGRNSGGESVRMHHLIRDMAFQIQQENSPVMVKAGVQLKDFPDADEWTEDLVRVSLMHNQLQETPSNHSPRCPNLSTLLLCNNQLQLIADPFFKLLQGLKVLDLSHTDIEILPDFVSDLVKLNALLLKSCEKLRHVPSLQKLTRLKRLDLSRSTALGKIPQGIECLSNLRYLRLNGCGEKEFPCWKLLELRNLQVFVLENNMPRGYAPVTVKGREVASLTKLETLECSFEGYDEFLRYLTARDETRSLSTYQIFVGLLGEFYRNKSVGFGNLSINRDGDFQVMLPSDIEELVINNCNNARSLCDVSRSIKYATELEVIRLWYCKSMESLVSLPLPSSNGIFSRLKEFYCYRCRSMKKLFPHVLLPNLEKIKVENCVKMEEIIATRDEEDEEGVMGEESCRHRSYKFILPKLRFLRLAYLPELKSICGAKLIGNFIEEIAISDCLKLKKIPISIPLLGNEQPSPPPSLRKMEIYPEAWWTHTVEWEHPNAKDVLCRFVKFW